MKNMKFILSLIVVLIAININAQSDKKVTQKEYPEITFSKKVHDFGDIKEGDVVETTFSFSNSGKAPLLITKIKASCGCTIPSNWKKEAILPGETSSFTVKFNSKNKPNIQSKRIKVFSNTKNSNEYVTIKAVVAPDPEMQKAREERMKKWKEKRDAKKKMQEEKSKNTLKGAVESPKKGSVKVKGNGKPNFGKK
jgi:hypothetical protein